MMGWPTSNAASDSERVFAPLQTPLMNAAQKKAAEFLDSEATRQASELRQQMLDQAIRAEGAHATPEEILATAAKFASFIQGEPKPKPPPPAIPIAKLAEAVVYRDAHSTFHVSITITVEHDRFRLLGQNGGRMGLSYVRYVGFEAFGQAVGNPLMQAMAHIYKALS